ncbi:MAG: porin [Burkholderiaceae bacterium]
MNKKLLVAAAAALTCFGAQAQSVSLYGLLDVSMVNAKAPGAAVSTTALQSGNMTTSYWGLKATENLGGGLSAEANLESFVRLDSGSFGRFNGDPLFSRNANVALKGGFGTVTAGRVTNSLFVNNLIFNALGDSFGFSPAIRLLHLSSGQVSGDTGWNEAIRYTAPSMSGTTVSVLHAVKGSRPGANTNVSALHFSGPLSMGASWQEVRRRDGAPGSVGASDSDAWQIGAAYDAKVVKVFAQISKVENKTFRVDYDHMGVGAAVPLSAAGKVLVQYTQMEPSNAKSSKTTTVAYDHFLSKRTDLYTVYMNERAPAGSGNTVGVGVRHRF